MGLPLFYPSPDFSPSHCLSFPLTASPREGGDGEDGFVVTRSQGFTDELQQVNDPETLGLGS